MGNMKPVVWDIPIAVLIALTVGMLPGCTTEKIIWDKPGITQAEQVRDENACLRAAIATDGGGQLLVPYGVDREIYTRCMEGRGYTVRSKG